MLTNKEAIERIEPCLVSTWMVYVDGARAVGTGFVLTERRLIVTCLHVVSGGSFMFCGRNGKRLPFAKQHVCDTGADLYVTVAQDNTLPYLELSADRDVEVGEEVMFGGYLWHGDSKFPTFHKGMVSGITSDGLQIDGPVNRGNSGGPLVSLRTGRVVGVVRSMAEAALNAQLDDIWQRIPANIFAFNVRPRELTQAIVQAFQTQVPIGIGYATPASRVARLLPGV